MSGVLWLLAYLIVGCISCGTMVAINRANGGDSFDGLEVAAYFAIPFWPVILPASLAIVGGEHLGRHVSEQRKERAYRRRIKQIEQERLLREAGLDV